MHVCFFSHYSKTHKNGASLSLINIAKEMANRGIKVTIIIPNKDFRFPINHKNIKMINIPMFSKRTKINDYSIQNNVKEIVKIAYNTIVVRKVSKILKDNKPDIIHINGLDSSVGARVAKSLNVLYIWHIRQLLEEDFGIRLHNNNKIYQMLEDADSVIAVSRTVKEKFEKKLGKEIEIIYNGIPLDEYVINNKKPLFSQETINILLAGRIVEQKGQLEAIKAIKYLVDNAIWNVKLTIIGSMQDNVYVKEIKEYIKRFGLNDYIQISDHVNDLREIRKAHDIGLICSRKEAFGRVTIETMASGMLVIGANTGGTLEIIKDHKNGYLYNQGDPESLAEKIKYIINNKKEAISVKNNGYRTALEKYSISQNVDRIIHLYKRIL